MRLVVYGVSAFDTDADELTDLLLQKITEKLLIQNKDIHMPSPISVLESTGNYGRPIWQK